MTDTSKDKEPETDVFQLLHRAEQRARMLYANEVAGVQVTLRQIAILNAIKDGGTIIQSEIVQRTGIDRSTVTELMGRMDARGLVTRVRDRRDARAYLVTVTKQGEQQLTAAAQASQRAARSFIGSIPSAERPAFLNGLATAAGLSEPQESDDRKSTLVDQ